MKKIKEVVIEHPISSIILIILVGFTLFFTIQTSNRMAVMEEKIEEVIELYSIEKTIEEESTE